MEEVITIDTSDAVIPKVGSDLLSSRENVVNAKSGDIMATVAVTSYNRYEKTIRCVESVLQNTKDVNYKLILICNGCSNDDGKTLEYFKTVDHPKKVIFNVTKNVGSTFAISTIEKNIEGKYFTMLADDVIVTPRWLSNLIKCAESDKRIGMVNPVESYLSNRQQVDLEYSDYDEMQKAADEYNKSDPTKWHERVRLVSLGSLFKMSCIEAIGKTFDTGFFHDFGDDDVSFKIRRAGYKCILAKDTWICHDHDLSNKDGKKAAQSIDAGRKNFQDKYFGIDAWDDVNNYVDEFVETVKKTGSETPEILGIDVKCGTPVLEIQNKLREYEIYKTNNYGYTANSKYFLDLQTICGSDNVVCDKPESILNYYDCEKFDYIIIGENINSYAAPFDFVKNVSRLLKKDGQLFIYLKNTYDIFSFLNSIGYRNIYNKNYSFNFTLEDFFESVLQMNLKIELISGIKYDSTMISQSDVSFLQSRVIKITEADITETMFRLITDKYAFVITRK